MISTYSDNQCENENLGLVGVDGDGVAYTTEGQAAAAAICKAARNDGSDYSAEDSVLNENYYACTRLTPVATDTAEPAPSATSAPIATATDTPVPPTNAPVPVLVANSRAVTKCSLRAIRLGSLLYPGMRRRRRRKIIASCTRLSMKATEPGRIRAATHSRPTPRSLCRA